jgi:serine/threonine protein kinase
MTTFMKTTKRKSFCPMTRMAMHLVRNPSLKEVSFGSLSSPLSVVHPLVAGTKWIKGALIGAGSFGKVYLGMDASSGLLMAVKQVELPTGSAPNEERKITMLTALELEIELLKDLQHENIVQYLCQYLGSTSRIFH